jgi:hypothetical protein
MDFNNLGGLMCEFCVKGNHYPLFSLTSPLTRFNKSFKWPPTLGSFTASQGRGSVPKISIYMPRHDNLHGPYFENISTLAQILNNFGVVTGLSTNFGKSPWLEFGAMTWIMVPSSMISYIP